LWEVVKETVLGSQWDRMMQRWSALEKVPALALEKVPALALEKVPALALTKEMS